MHPSSTARIRCSTSCLTCLMSSIGFKVSGPSPFKAVRPLAPPLYVLARHVVMPLVRIFSVHQPLSPDSGMTNCGWQVTLSVSGTRISQNNTHWLRFTFTKITRTGVWYNFSIFMSQSHKCTRRYLEQRPLRLLFFWHNALFSGTSGFYASS